MRRMSDCRMRKVGQRRFAFCGAFRPRVGGSHRTRRKICRPGLQTRAESPVGTEPAKRADRHLSGLLCHVGLQHAGELRGGGNGLPVSSRRVRKLCPKQRESAYEDPHAPLIVGR